MAKNLATFAFTELSDAVTIDGRWYIEKGEVVNTFGGDDIIIA